MLPALAATEGQGLAHKQPFSRVALSSASHKPDIVGMDAHVGTLSQSQAVNFCRLFFLICESLFARFLSLMQVKI